MLPGGDATLEITRLYGTTLYSGRDRQGGFIGLKGNHNKILIGFTWGSFPAGFPGRGDTKCLAQSVSHHP
jgi:hypothetical protein